MVQPLLKRLNPADRAEKRGPSFLGTKTSFNIADWLPRHMQENWEFLFLHLSKNKSLTIIWVIKLCPGVQTWPRLGLKAFLRLVNAPQPQFAKDGTKQVKGLL